MIMLIEAVPVARIGLLRKQTISVENQMVLGMKVMSMTVPIPVRLRPWQRERLKRRVLELLGKLRISTVCINTDFPYPEWFDGYRKPDGSVFIKRLLGKIAVMVSQKHDTVYVYLKRSDSLSSNALSDLCQGFRHILLSGPNVDIADSLYRRYGASVIIDPTTERIMIADAAVFFDEPLEMPEFKESCIKIRANDSMDVEFSHTNGEKLDIPDGYPQNMLISEAILRGCVRFDDIQIVKSKISP